MKQEKTISKTVNHGDGDWPPEDAAGALAWFQAKLAGVPAEFRSSARIEINSEDSYGSGWATIKVSYVRSETDEEKAWREQEADAQANRRRAEELRTLAALQAKYGNPGV